MPIYRLSNSILSCNADTYLHFRWLITIWAQYQCRFQLSNSILSCNADTYLHFRWLIAIWAQYLCRFTDCLIVFYHVMPIHIYIFYKNIISLILFTMCDYSFLFVSGFFMVFDIKRQQNQVKYFGAKNIFSNFREILVSFQHSFLSKTIFLEIGNPFQTKTKHFTFLWKSKIFKFRKQSAYLLVFKRFTTFLKLLYNLEKFIR